MVEHMSVETVLTPQRVFDWLQEKRAEEMVGVRENEASCPLARYLGAVLPGSRPRVNADSIVTYGDAARLPRWADLFISMVDDPPETYWLFDEDDEVWRANKEVTAAEALLYLGQVAPELAS